MNLLRHESFSYRSILRLLSIKESPGDFNLNLTCFVFFTRGMRSDFQQIDLCNRLKNVNTIYQAICELSHWGRIITSVEGADLGAVFCIV